MGRLIEEDQKNVVEMLDYSRGNKLWGAHYSYASWSPPSMVWPIGLLNPKEIILLC
jgi:hypothetical protein